MMPTTLPTGEEPPKGYESLVGVGEDDGALHINCVFLSQLAHIEKAEIESLRKKALEAVRNLTGLANGTMSFEDEVNIIPGRDASDKLLFRAYRHKDLQGYALVHMGWPQPGEWAIQHMIIDPANRLQGIGTSIVHAVEDYAQHSDVDATCLFAIPVQQSGASFWNKLGYSEVAGSQSVRVAGVNHDLLMYRNSL
jgi:GNAT superfamily N-acetyltransferase